MKSDFDGLGGMDEEEQAGEPKPKRMKLKTWDLMPAQSLNSMGLSNIEGMTFDQIRKAASKGNKQVFAFSEFADKDPKRQGIAVSRLAAVLSIAFDRLYDKNTELLIKEKLYAAAKKEAEPLRKACTVLNGGTKGMSESVSLRYAKSYASKTEEEVQQAAKVLYDWLVLERSSLRSVLAVLSGAGIWYVAQCHEKTARAFVEDMNLTEFTRIAKARLCTDSAQYAGDFDCLKV